MRTTRTACAGNLLVGVMAVCVAGGLSAQLTAGPLKNVHGCLRPDVEKAKEVMRKAMAKGSSADEVVEVRKEVMGCIPYTITFQSAVSVVSNSPPPPWRDDHFHGTHVGGIVVANGIGVSGVAPHSTLIAVKVLNASGSGSFGDIIAGIIYATDVGADVINMSLGATFPKNSTGGGQLVAALNRAVNYAHRNDVVVVSAAGNANEDLQHNGNRIAVPCQSGVGMCISATGPTQAKASYSNYGSSAINVAAPGGENALPASQNFILSPCSTYSVVIAACRRPFPTSPFRYLFVIGTSQAAPHVSGIAALKRAQGLQGASQIITTIEQTADDLGKPGTDQVYGRGRVNAFRAWTN